MTGRGTATTDLAEQARRKTGRAMRYDECDPMRVTTLLAGRVDASRRALRGERRRGRSLGRSMFDAEVISFAHGNGLRPPESTVLMAGVAAILDQRNFPLERYNFLERYAPLDEQIRVTMREEGFPEDHIMSLCIDAGTTKLILSALMSLADPGDVILAAPTFYHGLVGWSRLLSLGLQIVPTSPERKYKLDLASLDRATHNTERRWKRRPRALILFNPSQTGALYTAAELDEIAAWSIQNDIFVIEDCIFGRTRFDQRSSLPHLASHPEMKDRVVSVDGCSKAEGLANLRIGWAMGPPDLLAKMEAIKAATTVGLPYITMEMARTALAAPRRVRDADAAECAHRADTLRLAIEEMNEIVEQDRGPGSSIRVVHPPEAGHSMLVDAGPSAVKGERSSGSIDITELWLGRAAVAVSPLCSSALYGREIRLNYACVTDPQRGRPEASEFGDITRCIGAAGRETQRAGIGLFRRLETIASSCEVQPGRAAEVIRCGIVDRVAASLHTRAIAIA